VPTNAAALARNPVGAADLELECLCYRREAIDDLSDFADLLGERRILERTHHHATPEEAEVAAARGRTRILRFLLRQCREAGRIPAECLHQRLCLVHDATDVVRARICGQFEQDVTGLAFLGYAKTRGVAFVEGADLLVADAYLLLDRLAVKHHVFGLQARGALETVLIGGVVGLDLIVAHRDLGLQLRHWQTQLANAALLELCGQEAAGRRSRRKPGLANGE